MLKENIKNLRTSVLNERQKLFDMYRQDVHVETRRDYIAGIYGLEDESFIEARVYSLGRKDDDGSWDGLAQIVKVKSKHAGQDHEEYVAWAGDNSFNGELKDVEDWLFEYTMLSTDVSEWGIV